MDRQLEQEVRSRAAEACEYCHMRQDFYAQRFPIDHIVARQHGGQTRPDNLALSCPTCNRFKGPNVAGVDPIDGQVVPLFHPRRDRWNEHFCWNGAHLVGLTSTGRTTIAVLNVNLPRCIAVRESLIIEGVFP